VVVDCWAGPGSCDSPVEASWLVKSRERNPSRFRSFRCVAYGDTRMRA
jgi:hypothetical protein